MNSKKSLRMEFRDFYEFATKVTKYEDTLKEETQCRKTSMGSYCLEVTNEEVATADLVNIDSHIYPLLVKKNLEL